MRIGIDIRDLAFPVVGVGNTTLQLLRQVVAVNDRTILYKYSTENYCQGKGCVGKLAPIAPYSFGCEQVYFGARTVLDRLDIFHAPIHLPPFHRLRKTKIVFTVHDLHSELDETYFPPEMNNYFKERRHRAIEASDAVVVHSAFVRSRVLELCKVSEKKIFIVPLSVPEQFSRDVNSEKIDTVKRKYKLPERYVLFVGSIEPWKKVQILIREFTAYQKKSGDDMALVIVGRPGWHRETCNFVKEAVATSQRIRWLDYVPSEDLPAIYKAATVFCSASLWEGFGIIYLEAMAQGLPIIATEHAATPEVVGDAGVFFNTTRAGELQKRFEEVLNNENVRQKLREAGKKRCALFTSNNYGAAIYDIYKKIMS
jgi:glycosyltransferase involved in cell wall biosynthesis